MTNSCSRHTSSPCHFVGVVMLGVENWKVVLIKQSGYVSEDGLWSDHVRVSNSQETEW